ESDWSLMPNVAETLRAIPWRSGAGPWLGIVSNQSGVGENLLSERAARGMIVDTVRSALGYVPPDMEIEMCVCRDAAACPRKKPNCAMLTCLLENFSVAASEALLVGDLAIDAEAAKRPGLHYCWAGEFFGWNE